MRAVTARVLISALPLLLVGLTAASLLSVKQARAHPSNQLVIAVAGEPETLNPLLFTTQVAHRIGLLLFDGLLRLDENLEPAPSLAESWTQTQTTTIFFRSTDAAARAARAVETLRSRWDGWALRRVEPIETELRLFFSQPGTRSSAEIFTLLDPSEIERLSLLRLRPAPSDVVTGSSLVKRSWRDGSRAIELTIAAAPADAMRELERFAGERIAKSATPVGELPYLDEPEIVFRLRPGVTWHDGTPFSAEDVVFTYRAIVDDSIGSPRRADYQLVQTVEIPDPRTVRIIYRKPYSFALNSWSIGILPQHLLAGRPAAWWIAHFNRQPIGTGAFRFEKWQTNEQVTLVKNPEHFRGTPHLDRIAFRIIPDRVSAGIAFQTEQIDVRDLDPYAAAQLEKKAEVEVLSAPALEYHFIGWNLRRTALRDKRVRQALAHAIDVEAILRDVIYGRGVRATGPYVPGMFFFNENVAPIPFDPDRAELLLGEAGWKRGADGILVKEGERFHLQLVTNNDNPVRKDIATLAQRYLRQVGIEVEVRAHEWATFISQVVLARTFDGVVLSWALRNDPDQYQIWHSSQTGPRQLNIAGYEDRAVDALLEQLRIEYEQPRIKLLASELQKKIYEDQPYTFLHVPLQSVALQPDRFRLRVPGNGQWQERPVVMSKAGLQPEWFCRVLR